MMLYLPNRLALLLFCCLLSTYSYTQMLDHVPGEVLVKIKPNKSIAEKTALKNRMNASTLKTSRCKDVAEDLNPYDTHYTNLWGLHNTGQNGGTADADIDAPEGWDIATRHRLAT